MKTPAIVARIDDEEGSMIDARSKINGIDALIVDGRRQPLGSAPSSCYLLQTDVRRSYRRKTDRS